MIKIETAAASQAIPAGTLTVAAGQNTAIKKSNESKETTNA